MMGLDFGGMSIIYLLIFWVIVIGLAIGLLSLLFPRTKSDSSSHSPIKLDDRSESPLEILQQRYARGEISQGEYEEMRQNLEG